TAIAFSRSLAAGKTREEVEDLTEEMMRAAIADGVRAAPRANLRAATPFSMPRDLRTAIGFLAVSALAAGLALPSHEPVPAVYRAVPDHAPPGADVAIKGTALLHGASVPVGAAVMLGTLAASRSVSVTDWQATEIHVKLPA